MRNVHKFFLLAGFAVLAGTLLGIRSGNTHSAAITHSGAAQVSAPAPTRDVAAAAIPATVTSAAPANAKPRAWTAAELNTVGLRELYLNLAQLENLSAQGQGNAAWAVYRVVSHCVGYQELSDQQIETAAQSAFERGLRLRSTATDPSTLPPEFDPQRMRDARRGDKIEQREICAGIPAERRNRALQDALRAVELGDRDAVLGLGNRRALGPLEGSEVVRHADELARLQELLERNYAALIAAGDREALLGLAFAHQYGFVLPEDFDRAYVHAYAASLLGGPEQLSAESLFADAARGLDAERIATDRALGEQLARTHFGWTGR